MPRTFVKYCQYFPAYEVLLVFVSEVMSKKRGDMQEVMATARNMISIMDIVCNQRMAPPGVTKEIMNKRKFLNWSVERFIKKLYPDGPPGREKPKDSELLRETKELVNGTIDFTTIEPWAARRDDVYLSLAKGLDRDLDTALRRNSRKVHSHGTPVF